MVWSDGAWTVRRCARRSQVACLTCEIIFRAYITQWRSCICTSRLHICPINVGGEFTAIPLWPGIIGSKIFSKKNIFYSPENNLMTKFVACGHVACLSSTLSFDLTRTTGETLKSPTVKIGYRISCRFAKPMTKRFLSARLLKTPLPGSKPHDIHDTTTQSYVMQMQLIEKESCNCRIKHKHDTRADNSG